MLTEDPGVFFFIGIGGAGMSALARILLAQGYAVAGSDIAPSAQCAELTELGATIYSGHRAEQIDQHRPAYVIISQTAIAADNSELVRAQSLGIPIIYRSDLLACLLEKQFSLVIAGTHGKTSTTAMTVNIMHELGIDASYAIGGQLTTASSGGYAGAAGIFICEADESDGSFIKYAPNIAVITNIDPDHMDFFATEQAYWEGFVAFSRKIQPGGALIICIDSPLTRHLLVAIAQELTEERGVKIFPYTAFPVINPLVSLSSLPNDPLSSLTNDLSAVKVYLSALSTLKSFDPQTGKVTANFLQEEISYTFRTSGIHMVANSMAAILASHAIDGCQIPGSDFSQLHNVSALGGTFETFPGTKRRCELRETVAEIKIIDDYAHHPTEVRAVISGLRATYPRSRILVVFQPHMFSRTRDLSAGFREALELADIVNVVDIYPAREQPIAGITSRLITDDSSKLEYIADLSVAAVDIAGRARPGDIIVTMGAGSVTQLSDKIAQTLRERFVEGVISPTLKA